MSFTKNSRIAEFLYEIGDLLDLKGVQFKPRAYRRAAQNIETLSEDIGNYYEKGKIQDIPGVGESIATKIEEIIETGELEYLQELRQEFPSGLRKLMDIQGVGPKTLLKLNKELDITSLEDLKEAADNQKIRELEGFGEKSEQNIIENIKLYEKFQGRHILGYILPIAENIKTRLKELDEVIKIRVAGSIRRMKETIGDVDILVTSKDPGKVMDFFVNMEEVKKVVSKGHTRSTIIAENNLQVDLRVVDEESFGSALQYFTGSKEHNIQVRQIALDKNYKLSEYGLMDKKENKKIAGRNEEEIYTKLGLTYVVPELRENRGEVEAALNDDLPDLVELADIKGDLHVHTKWSEGSHSIEEMADTAQKRGYEYLAICDHAKTLQIAQGMSNEELESQIKKIEDLNEEYNNITILTGIEANIDSEGGLDVSEDLLEQLDFVVASIHSGFKQSKDQITNRIITAIENEFVNAIGHPTGRILNERESYNLDLVKIFEKAVEHNVFMEINAFPERLDLSDMNCKKAKEHNVKLAINTDSHSKDQMRYMNLGITTARRGWLEKSNIVNCLSLKELRKRL
ncbi:MAG: DNA polymerase/3'-5' exonuclease PolX [Promethearchaeia archaeon]